MKRKIYTVMRKSSAVHCVKHEMMQFYTVKEAEEFCNLHGWKFVDANGFVWEMYINWEWKED